MRKILLACIVCGLTRQAFPAADPAKEFTQTIRPVLLENCGTCHSPKNAKNRVDFLKAETVKDIESRRGMWHSLAAQLRNRTMPPGASKLSEDDRFRIAKWVDDRLRLTACDAGDYVGAVSARRLNRREYHNTIRDLLGVELAVADIFPADGSGGEGFDTNGETLYTPPLMMERYMEAAQQILDRVIITPPVNRSFASAVMEPVKPSAKPGRPLQTEEAVSTIASVSSDGEYNLRVNLERPRDRIFKVMVKVDGNPVGTLTFSKDANGGATNRATLTRLTRGSHTFAVVPVDSPIEFYSFSIEQRIQDPPAEKRALHYKLFGMEPGQAPVNPRDSARRLIAAFLSKAYRRPVEPGEAETFLKMYDRSAERGDPFEERVKLALKAVLVSPYFLFRIEDRKPAPGIHALGQHDLASRLSYFLWSTMPDEELARIAEQGRLQDPKVLAAQVDRMLDDPRSRTFAHTFIGQWLGTQDVGGRLVPAIAEVQHFYTPDTAADLREEPVLLFHNILGGNRSLLELINANYTFLTERLVKFYELEGKVEILPGSTFQRVEWPDNRRAGVLGLGSVLAMTSHYRESSPVLRGAWVLDTLLGTPVPPPPPDVPPLETGSKKSAAITMREKLAKHRADPSCSTCHNVMDPIGFGLENFDWMGRWRDRELNGKLVDASAVTPAGEKFSGPVELRGVLLNHKEDFLRHLTAKILGYALGRSLQDGDHCTIQRLVDAVQKDNYRARTLIREIVLSIPFRNYNPAAVPDEIPAATPVRKRTPLLGEK